MRYGDGGPGGRDREKSRARPHRCSGPARLRVNTPRGLGGRDVRRTAEAARQWRRAAPRTGAVGRADGVAVLYADVPVLRPETVNALVARHDETGAALTLLTARRDQPDGLGRVVRSPAGRITGVVEEKEADDATRAITECNVGVYCLEAHWLWDSLASLGASRSGEVYLTDLVAAASDQGLTVESQESEDPQEALGVNDRIQLAEAEAVLRRRILNDWMTRGVSVPDPSAVYIDATVPARPGHRRAAQYAHPRAHPYRAQLRDRPQLGDTGLGRGG